MRVVVGWILTLGLAVLPAMAETDKAGEGTDSTTPPAKANKDAPAAKAKKDDSSKIGAPAKPEASSLEGELQELRDLLVSQSKELETTREQLRQQQQRMEALENRLQAESEARTGSETATAHSAATQPAASATASAASGQPMNPAQAYGNEKGEKKSPLSFKIGDAEFTPGGFMDLTSVNRTTNVGSGIGTSFGSIPYNNTLPQARLSESRLTAQNSRLSLRVNSKFGAQDILGYVEVDFLGFQPPNANTTSNSNSLRTRLYFVDIKRDKWEFQGGQMWTWMTPNRVGLSPMPSDIFYSQNMDTNYQVGLTWARQTGFRIAYHPTSFWAIGVSVENPQQFVPGSVVFPSATFATQFDNGSGSTSASTSSTNPAVPNLHPDVIVKSAWDAKVGDRNMHFEVAGLVRSFKVFNSLATPATTNSITGGGGSVNVNLELIKNLHFIGNSFYSYGGGRYIFGLGPDVIVRPDGTLSGVHSGSGIGGFEWQANPKYMLYGYYGGAYFQRNFGLLPGAAGSTCNGVTGFTCVGFGFPGSSNSANRAVQEGTFGIIPTLWSNPNYGKLQVITQYSYLTRAPWFVAAGAPKNAHTNLIYADLRYTLP